uniref:proline-rich receptor-like protein kinase PERK14 n=1 Tax=Macaca mulatta TaxID=9544 RepID=UPI0010A24555|nr:proline-rich receptor-like protein kinase PERK14 [Macaca mulatta]
MGSSDLTLSFQPQILPHSLSAEDPTSYFTKNGKPSRVKARNTPQHCSPPSLSQGTGEPPPFQVSPCPSVSPSGTCPISHPPPTFPSPGSSLQERSQGKGHPTPFQVSPCPRVSSSGTCPISHSPLTFPPPGSSVQPRNSQIPKKQGGKFAFLVLVFRLMLATYPLLPFTIRTLQRKAECGTPAKTFCCQTESERLRAQG